MLPGSPRAACTLPGEEPDPGGAAGLCHGPGEEVERPASMEVVRRVPGGRV